MQYISLYNKNCSYAINFVQVAVKYCFKCLIAKNIRKK